MSQARTSRARLNLIAVFLFLAPLCLSRGILVTYERQYIAAALIGVGVLAVGFVLHPSYKALVAACFWTALVFFCTVSNWEDRLPVNIGYDERHYYEPIYTACIEVALYTGIGLLTVGRLNSILKLNFIGAMERIKSVKISTYENAGRFDDN